MAQRMTVSLPDNVVDAIKALFPAVEVFVVESIERELAHHEQRAALRDIAAM